MNSTERFAQLVIEQVDPRIRLEPRHSQSHGEYDFDGHSREGHSIAVEVTTVLNQRHTETSAAIDNPRRGGNILLDAQLKSAWTVKPTVVADIRKVRKLVAEHLEAIESAGLDYFWAPRDQMHEPTVAAIYSNLSVEYGAVLRSLPPGTVSITRPQLEVFDNFEAPAIAFSQEALKSDNLRKLSNPNHVERHLFVYVHGSATTPHLALLDADREPTPVSFPGAITHGWVATGIGNRTAIGLRATSGGPWIRFQCQLHAV